MIYRDLAGDPVISEAISIRAGRVTFAAPAHASANPRCLTGPGDCPRSRPGGTSRPIRARPRR